jgi:hypothetical protein
LVILEFEILLPSGWKVEEFSSSQILQLKKKNLHLLRLSSTVIPFNSTNHSVLCTFYFDEVFKQVSAKVQRKFENMEYSLVTGGEIGMRWYDGGTEETNPSLPF